MVLVAFIVATVVMSKEKINESFWLENFTLNWYEISDG